MSLLASMAFSVVAQTNLLENPGAEDGLTSWNVQNGGSGWLALTSPETVNSGEKCWISSYEFGTMSQKVNLIDKGFLATQLDQSPSIEIGVYIGAKGLNNGAYSVQAKLYDADDQIIAEHSLADLVEIEEDTDWFKLSYTFSSYAAGVRSVELFFGAVDGRFWAGNYGPMFDDAYVKVMGVSTGVVKENESLVNAFYNKEKQQIILNQGNGKAQIFDISGRLVKVASVENNEVIDMSGFNKGVYILRMNSQQFKFIVD